MTIAQCQELGSYLLLAYGKITQNWNLKEPTKNSNSLNMEPKRFLFVFEHSESKSGLYFRLNLILNRVLATFLSKLTNVFEGYQ